MKKLWRLLPGLWLLGMAVYWVVLFVLNLNPGLFNATQDLGSALVWIIGVQFSFALFPFAGLNLLFGILILCARKVENLRRHELVSAIFGIIITVVYTFGIMFLLGFYFTDMLGLGILIVLGAVLQVTAVVLCFVGRAQLNRQQSL